jgi:predicted nucleic acid-binding protein
MKLVIDANELFSAMIAKGRGRQTKKLDILFSDKVELFSPKLLFTEFERNREEIKSKSRFSDKDFDVFIGILTSRIEPVPIENFVDKLLEAKEITPHTKDLLYFALALKLDCAIWSGEKRLKEQSAVKVFNTKDLIELLLYNEL